MKRGRLRSADGLTLNHLWRQSCSLEVHTGSPHLQLLQSQPSVAQRGFVAKERVEPGETPHEISVREWVAKGEEERLVCWRLDDMADADGEAVQLTEAIAWGTPRHPRPLRL